MQSAPPLHSPPIRRSAPRLPRHGGQPVVAGRALPCGSGRLPADFPRRLDCLKELSGLTWEALAETLGVDVKRVLSWRHGIEPRGGAYHALLEFASRIPDGFAILMGEAFVDRVREG